VDEKLIKYGSRIVQLIKRYVGSVRTGNSSRRNSEFSGENLNRNQQSISISISDSEDGDDEESQSPIDVDNHGYVSKVIVSDANNQVVNGIYKRDGIFEGAHRFSKLGFDCYKYSIFKCTVANGSQCWWISYIPHGCIPGTTKDVDFCFASVTPSNELYPPLTGWKCCCYCWRTYVSTKLTYNIEEDK
jgi:hypothetical protein